MFAFLVENFEAAKSQTRFPSLRTYSTIVENNARIIASNSLRFVR